METKLKTCEAVHIEVQCERNDAEDISCGGPVMLGYSFYIPKSDSLSEYKDHIRECLKKYNRPYVNMVVTTKDKLNIKYLNDKNDIENIIKLESI
jgi:hypothetical protein